MKNHKKRRSLKELIRLQSLLTREMRHQSKLAHSRKLVHEIYKDNFYLIIKSAKKSDEHIKRIILEEAINEKAKTIDRCIHSNVVSIKRIEEKIAYLKGVTTDHADN